MRGSHGGVFIGHSGRFAVRAKLRDDLRAGSPLEPFLLRAPPWLGCGGATPGRGGGEVFAHMKPTVISVSSARMLPGGRPRAFLTRGPMSKSGVPLLVVASRLQCFLVFQHRLPLVEDAVEVAPLEP